MHFKVTPTKYLKLYKEKKTKREELYVKKKKLKPLFIVLESFLIL